jgi:hypothetical protein
MENSFRKKFSSPEDSRLWAQFIAMAPFVFQAAKSLRNLGVLKALKINEGTAFEDLREQTRLERYSLSVLLDAGESCGLLYEKEGSYFLSPAGEYVELDPLTRVNMNFSADVCYQGLASLEESLKGGKPEGLKSFGLWPTIYEGLTHLPSQALKSWFEFDHFFSDDAFPRAMSLVARSGATRILDVGGNTGKFAIAITQHDPRVSVTMLDHPAQLELAGKEIRAKGLEGRIDRVPMNLLDHSVPFPKEHDAIWMSQFLDCFSEADILQLMKRSRNAMSASSRFFILETFIDRQRYEAARFCLDMTSLYFTCMANGNSRMYRATDFLKWLDEAGLEVVEEYNVRLSHTLLECRRK